MLASYGVAALPFTGARVIEFLCAFAGHATADQGEAELAYRAEFQRQMAAGMNGMRVIEAAHQTHASIEFEAMRDCVDVEYVGDASVLESRLPAMAATGKVIAVVTVNIGSALVEYANSHAVVLGHDEEGWFAFDVNTGALIEAFTAPSDLGAIGDGLLLVGKG